VPNKNNIIYSYLTIHEFKYDKQLLDIDGAFRKPESILQISNLSLFSPTFVLVCAYAHFAVTCFL
jgi:hypothetical protein